MAEELQIDSNFRAFWARVYVALPGRGRLPAPDGGGTIEAAAADVAAALRRDGAGGLAPADPAPWWRVLARPHDSIRRGFGRRGVGPGHVVISPLLVLAADDESQPADPAGRGARTAPADPAGRGARTAEPGGLVEVGPGDRRVVLDQARAAYAAALAVDEDAGGVWG